MGIGSSVGSSVTLSAEREDAPLTEKQLEQIHRYLVEKGALSTRKPILTSGNSRFTAGRPVGLGSDGLISTSLLPTITPSMISPQGAGSGIDADTVDGEHLSGLALRTIQTLATSGSGSVDVDQIRMSLVNIPASGYITVPSGQRFLFAYGAGGSNNYIAVFLTTTGTIHTISGNGINTTNTGNYCVYWDAVSSTYRIGNNTGSTASIRLLLLRA